MEALPNWREKVPGAALIAGILSLCISGGLYLVYSRLDRPGLAFLILGVGLLAIYLVEDFDNVLRAFSGRHARYGGNTAAMILIFLAIIGVLNFLSVRHSYRWDLTAAREFSLSAQTVKVLQSLKEPVGVKAFFRDGDYGRDQARDLLKEYQRQTDRVQYEVIDWEARPGDALSYKLQTFPVIVMESGSRRQDVTGFTEQDLTSAVFKVSQGEPKKIYFSTGHGEPDIASMAETGIGGARQALEASNYQVHNINLATTATISDEVAALVIDAPQNALHEQEKKVVKEYLDRGGKVMLLIAQNRTADLSDILAPYGLQIGNGIAIDAGQALPRQPFVPVITSYPEFNPIVRDLQSGKQAVLLPIATQIGVAPQLPAGVAVTRLLETTEQSWLATDDKDINYRQGDVQGPLTLAVAVTADAKAAAGQQGEGQPQGTATPTPAGEQPKTRLVVFGSADFATNLALDAMANRQLFVNAVNWLSEEEELISIRPQAPVDRGLILTSTQANLVIYSSVLFLPLLVAAAGAWVWWNRR